MARHTGLAWEYDPTKKYVVATDADGTRHQIGATSHGVFTEKADGSASYIEISHGEREANGHLMASALALLSALIDLVNGGDPADARELISTIVEERLK